MHEDEGEAHVGDGEVRQEELRVPLVQHPVQVREVLDVQEVVLCRDGGRGRDRQDVTLSPPPPHRCEEEEV